MGFRKGVVMACAIALPLLSLSTSVVWCDPVDLPLGMEFGPCSGTESKPQSKLWYQDGSWWCIVATPEGNRIHELVGAHWVPLNTPDALLADETARADVLWDGSSLIVLLFGQQTRLTELSYDRQRRVYEPREGFPVVLPVSPESETAVVAQDGRGRLWVTWASGHQVSVVHSRDDHRSWSAVQVLQDSIGADEISTVVAFGADAIGVAWSDQARQQFGFRMRHDADEPGDWNATEVIASGERVADDHLNAAADDQGGLYLVSKNGRHELAVHRRDAQGRWSTRSDVLGGGHGTRPAIMVSNDRAFLLYTRWHAGLEIVARREAPLGGLDFGEEKTFLTLLGEDVRLTDVTGTKQVLPPGTLIALAHAHGRAWWNGWGAGISPDRSRASCMTVEAVPVQRSDDAVLALAFDEGVGSATFDASPASHVAFLGGRWSADMSEPTWVSGRSGSALRFDGDRQYVAIPDAPLLTPPGSFTLEAWVRRFRVWDNNVICAKGAPGNRTLQLRIDKDNRIAFLRDVAGEGRKHRVRTDEVTLSDSLWHHIACVVDLEQRESRIYLDGALVAAAPDSGITEHTPSTLYVGAREYKDTLREWWCGDIDQLRLSQGVRYDRDFVPPNGFPSSGQAVFLSWAPPVSGPDVPQTYEVLRRGPVGAFVPLFDAPFAGTSVRDVPDAAGPVTYRVQPVSTSWPATPDRQVVWPSATSAVPALPDSSATRRH